MCNASFSICVLSNLVVGWASRSVRGISVYRVMFMLFRIAVALFLSFNSFGVVAIGVLGWKCAMFL